jgi:hypothetical protein
VPVIVLAGYRAMTSVSIQLPDPPGCQLLVIETACGCTGHRNRETTSRSVQH